MKFVVIYLLVFFSFAFMTDSFRSQQQKFSRVKTAYNEKEQVVKELFSSKGIDITSMNIFIRAFKKEAQLEIWSKGSKQQTFQLIKTYDICASSGTLGPKRKQGDGQVPEGFYEIDRFNPASNFYLSLGINYPNASDKVFGEKGNLGGEIFIHGNCVTIGCMPLTDDKIKEVYLMAVEARSNGQQKIPVHIFPFRMNENNINSFEKEYKRNVKLITFWRNIKKGYDYFEKNQALPAISVLNTGDYSVE